MAYRVSAVRIGYPNVALEYRPSEIVTIWVTSGNTWGLCRDTGVCQSRAVRRSPGRHPLGPIFAGYHALGNANWQCTVPGDFG
jgi:hypothetical protein